MDPLIHLPVVAAALGFQSTRAVQVLCERFDIPIIRLSKRVRAMKQSDYTRLIAKASQREAA
jgi:hypothetical protein